MQLRFVPAAALLAAAFVSLDAAAAPPCVAAADSAQDLRKAGKFREARAQLLVCSQKSCNSVVRSDCEKWLKEVDEQTPSVIVRTVDARGQDVLGARVTIDDALVELDGKPVQVDPGQRLIKARAKSGAVAESKVLIAQGEKSRVIEIKFTTGLNQDGTALGGTSTEPPPSSDTGASSGPSGNNGKAPSDHDDGRGATPVVPITLAVVGAIALGAFAFFEISGQSGYSDLEDHCKKQPGGCSDDQIDPVRGKFVAAGVSLGISVVALGAAAVLYFTRKPSSSSASQLSPVLRF